MAQQTAFQWFIEQLKRYGYYGEDFIFTGIISSELIEQAKQMEKEQLDKAYYKGQESKYIGGPSYCEQYYNETYGTTNSNEVTDQHLGKHQEPRS